MRQILIRQIFAYISFFTFCFARQLFSHVVKCKSIGDVLRELGEIQLENAPYWLHLY